MTEGESKSASPLPGPLAFVRWLDKGVQRVEVGVCLGSLGLMILFAFAQVFLRSIQGSEFLRSSFDSLPEPVAWFDNVARHLVIWVGVLGASLATAEGRHISIEAFPKLGRPMSTARPWSCSAAASNSDDEADSSSIKTATWSVSVPLR